MNEDGISIHLFGNSLISLTKVLQFSVYKTYTHFDKFISKYLKYLDANQKDFSLNKESHIINGILMIEVASSTVENGIFAFIFNFYCWYIKKLLVLFIDFVPCNQLN